MDKTILPEPTEMALVNEVMEKVVSLGFCKGAHLLAHALYSACRFDKFPGPSILSISSGLDASNRELVWRLMNITREPDYSNDAQDAARRFVAKRFGGSQAFAWVESWER